MVKSKKILSLILALFMVIAVISGCSTDNSNDTSKEDQITIKFLHRWTQEPDSTFFNEVAKDFEKENPGIKVDVQAISNDPFKEKIKVVLGTDEAPDVFFTWPGEFTNRFIRAGKVMDLTERLNEDGWKDNFVQSQLEPFSYDDKYYGTPFRVDAKVFVYNKKIFKQAGVEVPKSWEEFIEVLKRLDEEGITPISFGNQAPWAISHYIGTLNQKMVPDNVRKEDYKPENGDFSNPGYVEALEKYEEMVPFFNENPNAIKHDEARISLFNSKSAMMYLEIVEIPEIENMAPEEFKENYGVFEFPVIEGGEGNQNYLTGYPEGFVVSANTEHPEEAVEFLKYLTGKEVGVKEAKELGLVNGIKNVVKKGDVKDIIYDTTQIVLNSEEMVNWLDADLHAKTANVYLADLQKLTDGIITPEEVMENVRKVAEEVRKEFK